MVLECGPLEDPEGSHFDDSSDRYACGHEPFVRIGVDSASLDVAPRGYLALDAPTLFALGKPN